MGVPFFPQTIPAATVVGRLASGAGPAEAIPIGSLLALQAWTPPGTGAQQMTIAQALATGPVYNVFNQMTPAQIADVQARTFLLDVSAAIQRAINYVAYIGGGVVWHPPGGYLVNSGLVVNNSDVKLIGAGAGSFHYSGANPVAASRYKWGGSAGGTIVTIAPNSTQWISGNQFEGIFLDGGTGAAIGVSVLSSRGGRYICMGASLSTTVFTMSCATGLVDNADSQDNYIEVVGNQGGSGSLVILDGIATANSSFNRIGLVDGNHTNGHAILIKNADNNHVDQVRLFRNPGGTGYGLFLSGGAFNQTARSNMFRDLSVGGGVYAEGTELGKASPSINNYIEYYDVPNGSPTPVIGTTATLFYGTLDGAFPAVAAFDNSGTSYGAGPTDVTWNTEIFDLANNFASPTFTAPKLGKYKVRWMFMHTAAITAGDKWVFFIVSTQETIGSVYNAAAAVEHSVSGEATIRMNAGDTVKLQIQRASGTGSFTLSNDSRFNRFEVNYISQGF